MIKQWASPFGGNLQLIGGSFYRCIDINTITLADIIEVQTNTKSIIIILLNPKTFLKRPRWISLTLLSQKNKLKENKNRKVDDDLGVCVLKLLPEVS